MKTPNKPVREYTDQEQLVRIWDRENISMLMNRRAFYAANNQREKELNELWVSSPENAATASYGKIWGYYVGMDEIKKYYVDGFNAHLQQQLDYAAAADPSVKNAPENLGIGTVHFQPLTTPLIEVAADGKTAKGMWYSIGQNTEIVSTGDAKAMWIAFRMGADFVKEDGQWKLWHLVEIYDVVNEDGTDYKKVPYQYGEAGHPLREEFGSPTISMLTHDERFNWWDNYPPEPDPYESFSGSISYGPEGHPDYKEVQQ